jgi:hypothetical protein
MTAKNKRQVTFYVSPAEYETINALSGGNRSEYIRSLIRRDAEARDTSWPGDTSDTRGQYGRCER